MLREVAAVALLGALVAGAPPGSDVPSGAAGLDVEAARQGVQRMLVATSLVTPAEIVDCPLLGSDKVDSAFQRAGVDAPLEEWSLAVGDPGAVMCIGHHLGFEDDPSFPQLEVELSVTIVGETQAPDAGGEEAMTVTDLPGGTVGACVADRFVTVCEESWRQDGLEISLAVADREYFDRVTASEILGELVPALVGRLAGEATDVADPLHGVEVADVEAAAGGLDRFVDANIDAVESDGERLDCPLIAAEAIADAVGAAGIEVELDVWTALLAPVTFPDELDPVPVRLTCAGGDEPSVRVDVIDFVDATAADEFVASVGIAGGGSPSDLVPGDLTVGTCSTTSGVRSCTEWWRNGGLVVGVWLLGQTEQIGEPDAATVLVDVLPDVLGALAAVDS